jgi:hypothetical protein
MNNDRQERYPDDHSEYHARNNPGPCGPGDAQDVPGFDRATGIDDPTPRAEYGDERVEPALGYPEDSGEERIELPIPDGAEYDIDDLGDGTIVVQWWDDDDTERDQ